MGSLTHQNIEIATSGMTSRAVNSGKNGISIYPASLKVGTTITAGTITVKARRSGALIAEDIYDSTGTLANSIDLADTSKQSVTIKDASITSIELTVTGFAGTATSINIAVDARN